jgi:RNA polymerase sigma-70 factor (ECF subfamily)
MAKFLAKMESQVASSESIAKQLSAPKKCSTTLAASPSENTNRSPIGVESLIDEYSQFLFAYAFRMTGMAVDAEDLTQQTFLIAYQKLPQLRNPASVKSWLCAILRSSWLKSIRKKKPRPVTDIDVALDDFTGDIPLESSIDSQAIQNLLNELPEDYRLVLLMFYFENLSYQEIALQLDVKMGTVMSRLSRAKAKLRERLGNPKQTE